jgi:hypothetical protein
MLRNTAIALAAASFFAAVATPTGALALGRGFGGGGFAHSFAAPRVGGAPHGFAGRGFVGRDFGRGHHFARFGVPFALGLGLGYGAYSYYNDPCYTWTPYGYRWVCGYDDY